jgi:hypothetical protein
VHAVIGRVGPFTGDQIAQSAHQLAQPPNGRDGLGLWLFCRQYMNAYKNSNYDFRSNGEQWLLNCLAAFRRHRFF